MDGKVAAEDQLKKLLADPQLMAALKERAAQRKRDDSEPDDREDKAGASTMAKEAERKRSGDAGRDRAKPTNSRRC